MGSRPRRSRRRQRHASAKDTRMERNDERKRRNAFNSIMRLLVYMWTGSGLKCSLSPQGPHFGSSVTSARRHSSLERKFSRGDSGGRSKRVLESSGGMDGEQDGFPAVNRLLKRFSRTWGLLKTSRTQLLQVAYWNKLLRVYHRILPRVLGCSLGAQRIRDIVSSLSHQVRVAYAVTFGSDFRKRHRTGGEGPDTPRRAQGGRWTDSKVRILLGRLVATGRGSREFLPRWWDKVRIPRGLFNRWQLRGRTSSVTWKKSSTREDWEADTGSSRWIKSGGLGRGGLTPRSGGPRSFTDKRGDRQRTKLTSSKSAQRKYAVTLRHDDVIRKYNKRMSLYRRMPLKAMSRLWGWFNQLDLPTWLRVPALSLYVWMFNCDLSEADVQDLSAYNNLSQFFQRTLRPGVRPVDKTVPLTSPADGRVLFCGRVENEVLEQVKGVTYSLEEFLGCHKPVTEVGDNVNNISADEVHESSPRTNCRHLLNDPVNNDLYQCIVYLAPGDYHHFHSPADWTVQHRKHFPGELFSVNPSIARWLQGLFCLNERAVYTGSWHHGFFSLTAVGATNVGSIQVCFDKGLVTNLPYKYPPGCHFDVDFTNRCPAVSHRNSYKTSSNSFKTPGNSSSTEVSRSSNVSKSGKLDHSDFERQITINNTDILNTGAFCSPVVDEITISNKCDEVTTPDIPMETEADHSNIVGTNNNMDDSKTEAGHSKLEDENIVTSTEVLRAESVRRVQSCGGVKMTRGQSFGKFNLGSTIVLIFEAPRNFQFTINPDERVVYGQGIGRVE